MSATMEQLPLRISRRAIKTAVDVAVIDAQPTLTAAINLAITVSGLSDDEICRELEIDPGHFSKIRRGNGHFPPDKIDPLMDYIDNEIPLIWQVRRRGNEMHPQLSKVERELEAERARAAELERKLETIMEFVQTAQGRR